MYLKMGWEEKFLCNHRFAQYHLNVMHEDIAYETGLHGEKQTVDSAASSEFPVPV